ncbi:hypothetical protein BV22DRAFT_1134803 [Leucogyrophana mollusca]|uniref:Uncharacterized protein n=1 Tax=Leucogyrophana mollusca TaxID=85980 RepID=A0ACB8AYX3_9AGAM|nr:hypothetical protein BV22DRAFT_1134803 [Leucogyrophana mollusca]
MHANPFPSLLYHTHDLLALVHMDQADHTTSPLSSTIDLAGAASINPDDISLESDVHHIPSTVEPSLLHDSDPIYVSRRNPKSLGAFNCYISTLEKGSVITTMNLGNYARDYVDGETYLNLAKSDTFSAFKQFQAYAENQTGRKIKGSAGDVVEKANVHGNVCSFDVIIHILN